MSSVPPVFLRQRDIPNSETEFPTVLEVCLSSERSSGQGSVVGAQAIRGLWRIYPATQQARMDLLTKGLKIRNVSVHPSDTNPYILKDDTGEEKPSTKLWINDLPISVADSEIKHSLAKLGCELRSAIISERARDVDRKLTRFLTGRRYIFISTPPKPLPTTTKISVFTVKLFHKEQQTDKRTPFCSKCLQPGHHHSTCTSAVVCKTCKQPGHKRGDPACTMTPPDQSYQEMPQSGERNENDATENKNLSGNSSQEDNITKQPSKGKDKDAKCQGSNGSRSRQSSRHTAFSKDARDTEDRSRSTTPKRRHPDDSDSPLATPSKLLKEMEECISDLTPEDSSKADHEASSVWG